MLQAYIMCIHFSIVCRPQVGLYMCLIEFYPLCVQANTCCSKCLDIYALYIGLQSGNLEKISHKNVIYVYHVVKMDIMTSMSISQNRIYYFDRHKYIILIDINLNEKSIFFQINIYTSPWSTTIGLAARQVIRPANVVTIGL